MELHIIKKITTICNQRRNTAMPLQGRKKDKLDVDIHIPDGPVRAHVNRWSKRHFGFMFVYHFFFKLLQCAVHIHEFAVLVLILDSHQYAVMLESCFSSLIMLGNRE